MHPLSREKRWYSWNTEQREGFERTDNRKKTFFEKNFKKVLVVQKLALPLHPLSERKPLKKKSSLKDLDINKQVVQDYL